MNITQVPIPQYNGRIGNWSPGRQGTAVDTVVIHWIDGDQGVMVARRLRFPGIGAEHEVFVEVPFREISEGNVLGISPFHQLRGVAEVPGGGGGGLDGPLVGEEAMDRFFPGYGRFTHE